MRVGPLGKAVPWGSYDNYSLFLWGPYACGIPMLVGPLGKAVPWGSYDNYSLCLWGHNFLIKVVHLVPDF